MAPRVQVVMHRIWLLRPFSLQHGSVKIFNLLLCLVLNPGYQVIIVISDHFEGLSGRSFRYNPAPAALARIDGYVEIVLVIGITIIGNALWSERKPPEEMMHRNYAVSLAFKNRSLAKMAAPRAPAIWGSNGIFWPEHPSAVPIV